MEEQPVIARLRRTLTVSTPLGPSDASQLTDLEVAAELFDPHNKSFNVLLRRDLSVLVGRRGSGKTALLNSYKYRRYLDKSGTLELYDPRSDFRAYDIVIDVVTYKQFDEMQRWVSGKEAGFRPVEALVDEWETMVTDYFFARLVSSETKLGRVTPQLYVLRRYLEQGDDGFRQEVREKVWGRSLLDTVKALFRIDRSDGSTHISSEEALTAATEHLASIKSKAVVLFDSMDEYDVSNTHFTRSLGALIRFISQFNARQERIKIKLGLPLEIFREVQRASANALKDLVSVDQLKWSAMELAQIAAHRFRLFLQLHDPEFAIALNRLDLNRREQVREFWMRFLPAKHFNRYGQAEDVITYVLRHTQLLPRQLLMIMQKVIVMSAGITGGFRELKNDAVSDAIAETEPLIANEILSAFTHVYPFAEEVCRPVFANFPTLFSFDELEDKWRRRGRPVMNRRPFDFDMSHFSEMLVRMGIVGLGHDETECYYVGTFGYDSLTPANIGEGQALCLHPIFSKHFNAAPNARKKAVMPKGAAIQWA